MSHITGVVVDLNPPVAIGPDTGTAPDSPNTWTHNFAHTPAVDGTKLLILHFSSAQLPAGNRLEVDLGYGTDVFTSADGSDFWTRPVNIYVVPSGLVPIRYITQGSNTGSVVLDAYGRGERHIGDQDPTAYSNCDPFLRGPSGPTQYTEPDYDPFWYCTDPPDWQNIACAPNDVRKQVSPSVGMMVHAHFADNNIDRHLSTCTVTLVDANKVITAGHCLNPDVAIEVESCSVIFGYETNCAGNRVDPYNPKVYKVSTVLEQRWQGGHDYCLLQLEEPVAGIPPVQLRHDRPAPGEQVFCIHHPNGAVKKLSLPSPGFTTVLASNPLEVTVPDGLDVSGGSSGSGLFDLAGRIVGVLSVGDPCNPNLDAPLEYYPVEAFLADTLPAPPPPVERDVMLVLDRSGSMSEDEGNGRKKIEVARDAVSLFVQLVRGSTGNRMGLTTFSTNASVVRSMVAVDNNSKQALVGPAPYSSGTVGAVNPGGATSIGAGLQSGFANLNASGTNPKVMLLLSDGMQNRQPAVADVEQGITSDIHAIGFGTEANLDGPLLEQLANEHGGLYMRAGNGLTLEKFFSQAFGNIFENGILFDPEFHLAEREDGRPIEFGVCGEETVTVVTGWDRVDAGLVITLTTPDGETVFPSAAGTESATGITWSFLRVKLPHKGERNGTWQVRVLRPGGGGEFPPPAPALRYFLNVIPLGGPKLSRADRRKRYYTGDAINPVVALRYENGGWPHAHGTLTLDRPDDGIGNILAKAGLGPSNAPGGDSLAPRFATLKALQAKSPTPLIKHTSSTFPMTADRRDTGGSFEHSGLLGRLLADQLTVEGNYQFHVKTTYGNDDCKGSRELVWGISVEVGIDPDRTVVTSQPVGPGSEGGTCFRITFTPRDKYGNHLGPGRADSLTVKPAPGSTFQSELRDLGNGSYSVDVCTESEDDPGIVIEQPERDPISVGPPRTDRFVYGVKFLCGTQRDDDCGCAPVRAGRYATEVTVHNPYARTVRIRPRVIPVVLAGAQKGVAPKVGAPVSLEPITLPGHGATMMDCCGLWEALLGSRSATDLPLTSGIVEILTDVDVNVTAAYTAQGVKGRSISIDTETVHPKRVAEVAVERPQRMLEARHDETNHKH